MLPCLAFWVSHTQGGGSEMEGRGRLTGVSWSRPPLLEEGIAIFILQVGKHLRKVSGLLRFTQLVGRTHTEVPRGGEGCEGGWTTVWRMFSEDDLLSRVCCRAVSPLVAPTP